MHTHTNTHKHTHTHTHTHIIIIIINLFNKTLTCLINQLTDVGLQNCTHQLHTKSSQLILNPGLHTVFFSKDHTGPLCQISLHDSVLRLLISKFCHFLWVIILKLADSMGG